jgi:glycosyltransferase involved in cell wall biosynthesis
VERAALAVVREPTVLIVVPVHNEERDLERSVRRLRAYLDACFPFHTTVTVADNASTDATPEIGARLADEIEGVRYMRISDQRRGRAIAAAWLISRADVLAYADIEVANDLSALLPLVAPLISGHSDLAIGSRRASGPRAKRGLWPTLVSRCYNAILRIVLGARFHDPRCSLKAIRREAARQLLPEVEDRDRFFDTELLVLAERAGLRIQEVAIDRETGPDLDTTLVEMAGVWRLMRRRRESRLKVARAG